MPKSSGITSQHSPEQSLAHGIANQVAELLVAVEASDQPLEIEPHRGRLFELFVMTDAAGFLREDSNHDLSCDGLGRELASRWNLARNLQPGAAQFSSLPPVQLKRLRLLWSFMRMWMEWTYAWRRWDEFHEGRSGPSR